MIQLPCQSPHFRASLPERARIPICDCYITYRNRRLSGFLLLRVFFFRCGLSRSRPLSSFSCNAQAKLQDTPQRHFSGKITILSRVLLPFRGLSPFQPSYLFEVLPTLGYPLVVIRRYRRFFHHLFKLSSFCRSSIGFLFR